MMRPSRGAPTASPSAFAPLALDAPSQVPLTTLASHRMLLLLITLARVICMLMEAKKLHFCLGRASTRPQDLGLLSPKIGSR